MIVLLSSLLGFLSSGFPSILGYFKDRQDKAHELSIMQLQIQSQQQMSAMQLQEIQAQANSAEMISLHNNDRQTGTWVDVLNATVRPALAYSFMISYFVTRFLLYLELSRTGVSYDLMIETLWDETDMAIFSTVTTFYFGNRYYNPKK